MGRTADKDPRRVVEEPRGSVLPYLIMAVMGAVLVWTFLPSSSDIWTIFRGTFDGTKEKEGPHPSRGDVRTIFSADDYPADAQANGQEGTVQAQLSVDSKGYVSQCTVIRSSGVKSLDEATCNILTRRARFRPARDAQGRAVPDTVVTPPVTWRLEG